MVDCALIPQQATHTIGIRATVPMDQSSRPSATHTAGCSRRSSGRI